MAFLLPYSKVHPQRTWTMEETKIPSQRSWAVQEAKIPHRPNSPSRVSRPNRKKDLSGAVVVNPSFLRRNNEPEETIEEEIEVQLMEPPRVFQCPKRVARKENLNVMREHQCFVKNVEESKSSEKPSPRSKIYGVMLTTVVVVSIVSFLLIVLFLCGFIGIRNCPCGDRQELSGSRRSQSVGGADEVGKNSENKTAWERRLFLLMEQRIEERELKENKTKDLSIRLELTQRELKSLKVQLTVRTVALWNSQNSTLAELDKLKTVWTAVNITAEKTSNLTDKVDREFKKVRRTVSETSKNLTKLTSSTKDLKLEIEDEIKTLWLNLNQSNKYSRRLKNYMQSFKENVTHHSQKLEARIEKEEQNSNNTKIVTDKHLRKIQNLEILMNVTRQEAEEANWQHSTALWSAGNFTLKEFLRVWTTVNASQAVFSQELRKVRNNFARKLNQSTVLLKSSDSSLFASIAGINATITEKVNNVSKMMGPIGPRGFNGSQGPTGPTGSIGPAGPKGTGDLSTCQYQTLEDEETPGSKTVIIKLNEPSGKRVIGVTCSADYVAEKNLSSRFQNSIQQYFCTCKTEIAYQAKLRKKGSCSMHYWQCPLRS
ncbi:uncharacterized protein LOC114957841 isoform X4 [Acropora millepora]|uniref:uncharacterized protein LOC114957841 isoform X4 n=1 Tax=Acropora millepora TaxID=45264 RepID=UPI001CF3AAFE|nr:uncharacterized protein LOC114957841 isoform X4 [Acropora millepora]